MTHVPLQLFPGEPAEELDLPVRITRESVFFVVERNIMEILGKVLDDTMENVLRVDV